jgi:hypothetical protein
MKTINQFINESSNTWALDKEDEKIIFGALDIITKLVKEDEFCKALGVERDKFDELYEDFGDQLNINKKGSLVEVSKSISKILK